MAVEHVRALEDARCAAMISADCTELEALLHDDLVYIHSSGRIDTKSSYMAALRERRSRYFRIERIDEQFRCYSDAMVVATGQATVEAEAGGRRFESDIFYSCAWVTTPDGWRFVLWHAGRRG